jgi:tripeptide aminopeptidase
MEDKAWFSRAVLERFLRYVRMDTTSDKRSSTRPSTEKQLALIAVLRQELESLSIEIVTQTDKGILVARIPATASCRKAPPIGFMAHVDTAADVSGTGVNPIVHQSYDGKPIVLDGGLVLDPEEYPDLLGHVGDTVVTSDGKTLLGADDKAGVAEIMTAAEYLVSHDDVQHGEIELYFTTDEEIGMGTDGFPLEQVHARACYTLDGDGEGTLEAECFNAYTVEVSFEGKVIHPGYARGKLVNAVDMAARLVSLLPGQESPHATDKRQGYYLATDVSGNLGRSAVTLNIRDFDEEGALRRIEAVRSFARAVEEMFPGGKATVSAEKRYPNMREYVDRAPRVVQYLEEAIRRAGAEPRRKLIRGGTDGSRLSEMGIPTPNMFDGGYNYHSRLEWAALSSMVKATLTVIELARIWADATPSAK